MVQSGIKVHLWEFEEPHTLRIKGTLSHQAQETIGLLTETLPWKRSSQESGTLCKADLEGKCLKPETWINVQVIFRM